MEGVGNLSCFSRVQGLGAGLSSPAWWTTLEAVWMGGGLAYQSKALAEFISNPRLSLALLPGHFPGLQATVLGWRLTLARPSSPTYLCAFGTALARGRTRAGFEALRAEPG